MDKKYDVPEESYGIHEAHCCKWHGCKYGDESCPVELGLRKQKYPCEGCSQDLDNEQMYRGIIKNIEEIKKYFGEDA